MSNPDPPAHPALIQVREARKTYRAGDQDYLALRGISLEICRGEFVVIMGPSGSGKSTLLHLLGGLDNPSSGQVIVAGQALHALNETRLALFRRKHVGFVFQSFNLIANLSVRDNVELPGLLSAHERPAAVSQRASELLETLGIASQAKKLPAQLSGGQRQRVAIARALINTPDILLADEPTGNLDSAGAADVMRLFGQLNQQGQTIVMVTHDPAIAACAERTIRLKRRYDCMRAILLKIKADLINSRTNTLLVMFTVTASAALLALTVIALSSMSDPYDRVFSQLNGAHLWLYFDRALARKSDLTRIEQMAGVSASSGLAASQAARVELRPGEKVLVSIRSLPAPASGTPAAASGASSPPVNALLITAGRALASSDARPGMRAVLVDKLLAEQYQVKVGDTLKLRAANGEQSLTVVGLALIPPGISTAPPSCPISIPFRKPLKRSSPTRMPGTGPSACACRIRRQSTQPWRGRRGWCIKKPSPVTRTGVKCAMPISLACSSTPCCSPPLACWRCGLRR